MKVVIDNDVYLVHFETRKFSPLEGRNTDMELEATDCIIRKVYGEDLIEISRGHVSQTACDHSNSVTARRLSFIKAIDGMNRNVRKAIGHEYNKVCRVTPRSPGQKNRQLRKRIAALTAQVAELKAASLSEEIVR